MTMTAGDRQFLLGHGIQKRIAAAEGVSRTYVSRVVQGTYPVPLPGKAFARFMRVRAAIAAQLGREVRETFGD